MGHPRPGAALWPPSTRSRRTWRNGSRPNRSLATTRCASGCATWRSSSTRTRLSQVGPELFHPFERNLMLQMVDQHWREHLSALDHLRQGIHLRGYAQKNPKQEYKREAFELFSDMLDRIKEDVVKYVLTVQVRSPQDVQAVEEAPAVSNVRYQHADYDEALAAASEAAPAAVAPAAVHARRPEGRPQRPLSLRIRERSTSIVTAGSEALHSSGRRGSGHALEFGASCADVPMPVNYAASDTRAVAAGSRRRAGDRAGAHQELVADGPAAGEPGARNPGGRRVHAKPLLRGAGARLPRAPGARMPMCAPWWSMPATPMPAPASAGLPMHAQPARRWPGCSAAPRTRCCRSPPASSWSRCRCDRIVAALPPAGTRWPKMAGRAPRERS